MEKDTSKVGSEVIKKSTPEKLHTKTQEYLFFQIYVMSQYFFDNYGVEELEKFFRFGQESFFNLKMSAIYKMMEGIIKRLPKALQIKEGLKMMVSELEFLESPKNIVILERTSEKAGFEITKCSFRKEFNRLAKKSNKEELLDKCCIWCFESIPYAEKYGFEYRIEVTKTGCLNYLE
jgi:hypothetical protein